MAFALWRVKSFCLEGQLVEHGDLLSVSKQVQEGLLGGFERELTTPNTLLISGSHIKQVEVPGIEPGSFGIKTGLLRA